VKTRELKHYRYAECVFAVTHAFFRILIGAEYIWMTCWIFMMRSHGSFLLPLYRQLKIICEPNTKGWFIARLNLQDSNKYAGERKIIYL